jgi:hypothetical protein
MDLPSLTTVLTTVLTTLHNTIDYTLGSILDPLISFLFISIAVSSVLLFLGILGVAYGKSAREKSRRSGNSTAAAVGSVGESRRADGFRRRRVREGERTALAMEWERGREKELISQRGERLRRRAGY